MLDVRLNVPVVDHYGGSIPEDAIFFKNPTKIGEILSGSTSYFTGDQPLSPKQKTVKYLRNIIIGLLIGAAICLIFKVSNPVWIGVWMIVPLIIAFLAAGSSTTFKGACNYIGRNGFAEYSFRDSIENIVNSSEVCFDEVTHLIKGSLVKKKNFNYEGTEYFFLWLNKDRVMYLVEDTHQNKNNEPGKYPFPYHFMTLAEDQWTQKLVEKMYSDMDFNGSISFDLIFKDKSTGKWKSAPYIRMGEGFVEFILSNNPVRYNRDEIKRVYFKEGALFIEHNNYEKKFFGFVEKGNRNGIPLTNIGNQKFFFIAFRLLMGYDL